jgi:hypothetical protein
MFKKILVIFKVFFKNIKKIFYNKKNKKNYFKKNTFSKHNYTSSKYLF